MEGASTSPQDIYFLPSLAFLILESFSTSFSWMFLAAAHAREFLCHLLGLSCLSYNPFPARR